MPLDKRLLEDQLDSEGVRKNKHMTHMEDLVLLGRRGFEELEDKIDAMVEYLRKDSDRLNITTKIDGAPAVFIWSSYPGYPDNSIGLKSFLEPGGADNAISSTEEIEARHSQKPEEFKEKLRWALELSQYIPAGECWQGDCLFTANTKKVENINGTEYITFQPNKIIYAFSEENPGYEQVKNADFGICFHTIYRGPNKSQSFRVDASRLNTPENIYILSPALKVNKSLFTRNLTKIDGFIPMLDDLANKLTSDPDYEALINNKAFMTYWNQFENVMIADNKRTTIDEETFIDELRRFIRSKQDDKYNKKMTTLKSQTGRNNATAAYNKEVAEIAEIIDTNQGILATLVKALNVAAEIKMLLWEGFKQSEMDYHTFYYSDTDGYFDANMEGIAVSDQEGNVVKIVDRSEFSSNNRNPNIRAGWQHESLEEGLRQKFYRLVENMGQKTAVVAFGSFNPPTIGHLKLANTIADIAKQEGGDGKIYLSHKYTPSSDPKSADPLHYEDKLYFAKKAFEPVGVEVPESPALNPYKMMAELYQQGYEKVIFVGGSDRIGGEEDYTVGLRTYNGKPTKRESDYYKVDLEFRGIRRDSNSNDLATKASATLVRTYAKNGDFDHFAELVPFDGDDAEDLFDLIRAGMGITESLVEAVSRQADRKYLKTFDDALAWFSNQGGLDKYNISDEDLNYIYSLGYNMPIIGDYGKFGTIAFTHEVENSGNNRLEQIISKARQDNSAFVNPEFHTGLKNTAQGNVEFLIADAFNNITDTTKQYHKVAKVLADAIGTNIKINKLETKDGGIPTTTWIEAGAYGEGKANATPKTDLISSDNKYKISLKKAGGSQLMSGKFSNSGSEALATLNVAVQQLGKEYSLDNILNVSAADDDINGTFNVNEVLKSFYSDEALYNKNTVISKVKGRSTGTDTELAQTKKLNEIAEKLNKFADKLQSMCDTDAKFKEAFMKEAATGNVKFGEDSLSAANCWFVYNQNTAKFYPTWNDFYTNYLNIHKIQILVNFKNAGAGTSVPYIVIRVLEKESKGSFQEALDEDVINEEKILLSHDADAISFKCKEFLDYIYSAEFGSKLQCKKDVAPKFGLTTEVRSILGNEWYSVRFSQNNVGDSDFMGDIKAVTILAVNKIADWTDKPLFNVVVNTANKKATVWLVNLAGIQHISGPNYARNGSDKFPDFHNITGSINGPDLVGDKVTSSNFDSLWQMQQSINIDTEKERIFNSTIARNTRLASKRKKVQLDYNKLAENINATIAYLESPEYDEAKAQLDIGAKLVYENKDALLAFENNKLICDIGEHIIRSQDITPLTDTSVLQKDTNLADIVIGDAYIDIKMHYRENPAKSGGKLVSIEKLIEDINLHPERIHMLYDYNLAQNKSYFVNVFDSEMLKNYKISLAWSGAGSLGHLAGVAEHQSNIIDNNDIIEFFKNLLGE